MASGSLNLSLKKPFCPSYLNDRNVSKWALQTRSNVMASNLLLGNASPIYGSIYNGIAKKFF